MFGFQKHISDQDHYEPIYSISRGSLFVRERSGKQDLQPDILAVQPIKENFISAL